MLKIGPYMRSNNATLKMMKHLLIALLPIVLFSFYKNGVIPYLNGNTNIFGMFYPLLFVLIASLSTLIIEVMYAKLFLRDAISNVKDYIKDSYSIIPGLFLALILPINTPIYILIFGAFMATIVGKMLFGGFGKNIFNPALIGNLFIMATYAAVIMNNGGYLNSYEVDTISGATPLTNVSMITGIGTYETVVKPYGGLFNFFVGTIPGTVGETSALLCLIAFVYLTITKVIKWRIPVFYIGTVFIMSLGIGLLNGQGLWYPLFVTLSGGLMFGAVFMATDPVTSPVTKIGQVIYGLCLGLLTIVFRYLTPYPEGVLTSILTMNMLVFIIDRFGAKYQFNLHRKVLLFIILGILILGTTFGIYKKYDRSIDNPVNNDFKVISSEVVGNDILYIVTQKGFSGDVKAKIIISNSVIISYELLEVVDDFYEKLEDIDYVNKLINEQSNLENVDTISGVTFSSSAIKKMFINTLKDYGDNYENH